MLIQELKDQILPQYGGQILSAQAGALTKACAQDLKTACTKYQNANAVGKLSQIQHHIDGVKNVMQDNIKTMLAHTGRVESIAVKAEELGLQAKMFQKQGKQLNRAMWWKNCKFKLMLIFIAVAILTVIIVAIYLNFGGDDDSAGSADAGGGRRLMAATRHLRLR